MSSNRHRKADGRERDYDSDRPPAHSTSKLPHTSSSRSKSKSDPKHHTTTGYVSDVPSHPPSLAHHYDTVPSRSKPSRHAHSSAQLPPTSAAKITSSTAAMPTATSSRAHRHPEPTYDSRTYPARSTSADRSNQPSADRPRVTEERKSSRHRTQLPSAAAATAGTSSDGPPYRTSPQEVPSAQKAPDIKSERSKDTDRAKDKERRREERRRHEEYQSALVNEQENRRQEEKRRDKEQRRREKEERRKEEERMLEQKAKADQQHVDPGREKRREPSNEREKLRGFLHLPRLGSDSRQARYKDSDESDNSLRKLARAPRHRHRNDSDPKLEAMGLSFQQQHEFAVPVSQSAAHAQVLMHRSENVPTTSRDTRRQTTPPQASRQLPEQVAQPQKRSKHSRSRSEAIPYPPGYATSASDNERGSQKDRHVSQQETRSGVPNVDVLNRHGPSAHTGSGSMRTRKASNAHQPLSTSVVPPSKPENKSAFSHWVFSRSGDTSTPKPPDSQYATPLGTPQPPSPAPLPIPPPRVDLMSSPPQQFSIRAAQGPSDQLVGEHSQGRNASAPSTGDLHRHPFQDPAYPVRPPSRSQGGVQYQSQQNRVPPHQPSRPAIVQQNSSDHRTHMPSNSQQYAGVYSSSVPHEDYHEIMQSSLLSPPVTNTRVPSNETRSHTPSPYVPSSGPPRDRPHEGHAYVAVAQSSIPPAQVQSTISQTQRDHLAASDAYYANAPYAGFQPVGGSSVKHSPSTLHQTPPKHGSSAPISSANHGYADGMPHAVATTPSNSSKRAHADLGSSFPIHEDGLRSAPQHQHQGYSEAAQYHPQSTRQTSHEAAKERSTRQETNVGLYPGSYGGSAAWHDPRSPKSTKTPSPGHHTRSVSQNTPPRETTQVSQQTPGAATQYLPSSGYEFSNANDPSRYNSSTPSSRNAAPLAYPPPLGYPSSSPHLDAAPMTNTHYSANPSAPSNVQHRSDNTNPSPRTHMAAPPAALRATSRTPSYDTGSTTLLGQTPSSQASVLIPGMSPPTHGQNMPPGIHATQQLMYNTHAPMPGSRSTGPQPTPTTRQPSGRQQPAPIPSPTLPAAGAPMSPQTPLRSQSQPTAPRVAAAPAPVRAYTQPQAPLDPYGQAQPRRVDVAGHSSTPAPSRAQQRKVMPSPSPEPDVLRTPSSLARSNSKLPMSPEPVIPPASYTQSLNEGKKPRGFFGLFRSKSTTGKRENGAPAPPDTHAQPPTTKVAFTGVPNSSPPDQKRAAPVSSHKKGAASVPVAMAGHGPDKKPSSSYAFSFRILSKRNRTMSAASAEAVDGTVGGASTVITSPAGSTRSPTPKLPPPQRDPVQATQDWRNREEAEIRVRGTHRRRRPGVTFEAYEDHPQAEKNKPSYSSRMRTRS